MRRIVDMSNEHVSEKNKEGIEVDDSFARIDPECKNFLKIQWPSESFTTIDKFIEVHSNATAEEIGKCKINYRGIVKTYKDYINDYSVRSNSIEFKRFCLYMVVSDQKIRTSLYFLKYAIECLNNGRLFTIKSLLIVDTDYNSNWKYGYVPQFLFRCIYFGTAVMWYSNSFDQILQTVYWAYGLYESANCALNNSDNDVDDLKDILKKCNYKLVMKLLKEKGLCNLKKQLETCYIKMGKVREWANFLKHKGGISYKYLEPKVQFQSYVIPVNENIKEEEIFDIGEEFLLNYFDSPIAIDIDKEISVLENVHKLLYECIDNVINSIDYDRYSCEEE